jgi:hypothetical protein
VLVYVVRKGSDLVLKERRHHVVEGDEDVTVWQPHHGEVGWKRLLNEANELLAVLNRDGDPMGGFKFGEGLGMNAHDLY